MQILLEGDRSRLVKLSTALPGTAAVRWSASARHARRHPRAVGDRCRCSRCGDLSTTIAALGGSTSATARARPPTRRHHRRAGDVEDRARRHPISGRVDRGLSRRVRAAQAGDRRVDYAALAAPTASRRWRRHAGDRDEQRAEQIMGAELMIRAGANVVIANSTGGTRMVTTNGQVVRSKLTAEGTMRRSRCSTIAPSR